MLLSTKFARKLSRYNFDMKHIRYIYSTKLRSATFTSSDAVMPQPSRTKLTSKHFSFNSYHLIDIQMYKRI